MTQPDRLIVGLSGASGIVYGIRLLQAVRSLPVEAHLVMSKSAEVTLAYETDLKVSDVQALADVWYPATDMGAALSSGSFRTLGMVVAPCSMRSLAEIAGGVTTSLLTRAADVVLKERRRLVLMVRETPLHSGAPAQHAAGFGHGGDHRAARPGLLRPPGQSGRNGRPDCGPGARPLRPGERRGAALGRAGRTWHP